MNKKIKKRRLEKMKKTLLTFLLLMLGFFVTGLKVQASDIKVAPVRNETGYLGRDYNPDFDKVFDDFTRGSLTDVTGTGLWWAFNETDVVTGARFTERPNYLHVNYSGDAGSRMDNPVYKAASAANTEGAYPYLVFVMRGSNGASIEDLTLLFRYDDNHNDIPVPFEELVDPDGGLLPELTENYQVYIIDVLNSLDGKEYTREGEPPIAAGSEMVGFHLLSDAATTGTIDIKEVYYSKLVNTMGYEEGVNNSLLDKFDRTDPNTGNKNVYWCGSAGRIIGQHLLLDGSSGLAHYRAAGYDAGNPAGTYENFVLRVRGESGAEDVMITPFYVTEQGEVWGDTKALSTLVGPDDEVVPEVSTYFQNLVINFEKNGWDKNVNGFKFETTNDVVYLDMVFFTNMEYNAGAIRTEYPKLDKQDILVFDNFKREAVGATPAFDANNPVALAYGFEFIIAYAGIDRLSIVDDNLVFDCTENNSHIQYTAVSVQRSNDGTYPYVVLKYKTTDGGSIANFRMQTIGPEDTLSEVVWANGGLKSGAGLVTAVENQAKYPYITKDGYNYLIVDLIQSGLGTDTQGFHLFYSGEGKLWIDDIFFAKEHKDVLDEASKIVFDDAERDEAFPADPGTINKWWLEGEGVTIEDGALVFDFSNGEHVYYQGAGKPGFNNKDNPRQYLLLRMKGAEGTDFNTFRIETISTDGGPLFFNAEKAILMDGSTLKTADLTTEYQTYVIDIVKSGLPADFEGIRLICGDWGSGKIYVDEISFIDKVAEPLLKEGEYILFDDAERDTAFPADPESINKWWLSGEGVTIEDGALVFDFSNGEHVYYHGAGKPGFNNKDDAYEYLILRMKGAEGTDFNTFRIETISTDGGPLFFNAGTVVLADGSILKTEDLTTEYKIFIIDLAASGLPRDMEGIRLICGDWGSGKIYVDEIAFAGANSSLKAIEALLESTVVSEKLPAPTDVTIEYANEQLTVSWTNVEGATSYTVYIYRGEEVVKTFTNVTSGKTFTKSELGLSNDTYTVKVQAVGDGENFLDSDLSESSASFTVNIQSEPQPSSCAGCNSQSLIYYSLMLLSACMFLVIRRRKA